jgi:glycosyltransferase involved in cell wall biosynthesis
MHILYYLEEFPKISETFILNEIYALEQAGHTVSVFALSQGENPSLHPEFEELEAAITYPGKLTYDDLFGLFTSTTIQTRKAVSQFARNPSVRELATLARTRQCVEFVTNLDSKIDVIHTHFATREKSACARVASYFDIPFTVTTHAFDIYREADSWTAQFLEEANRIITISEYNRNYMQVELGVQTPIDVVHAGIRPQKFTPSEASEPHRILTVARHTEKKGLHDALEAFAIAVREVPALEYHLVGSGHLSESLADTASAFGIENEVSFVHNVSDERLTREYNRARCFLLPCVVTESGERDGIPVALMEAMAMRTPPISTPVSGIPELVDHEQNGLLVDPRNREAIAQAILRLIRSGSTWSTLCQHGRSKVVKEFNVDREVEKLVDTFEAVNAGAE